MSDTLLKIDITFRYETYTKDSKDKKITKDYNILKDGLFKNYDYSKDEKDHDDIRNINFYNNSKSDKKTLKSSYGNIYLPFTANYITLENLKLVINSENKEKDLTEEDIKELYDAKGVNKSLFDKTITKSLKGKFLDHRIKSLPRDEKLQEKLQPIYTNITLMSEAESVTFDKYFNFFFENHINDLTQLFKTNEFIRYNRLIIKDFNEQNKSELIELTNKKSFFSKFKDNNYENFFKLQNIKDGQHIEAYFDKLKENYNKNMEKEFEYQNYENFKEPLLKLNTHKEFKKILYEYGKYFVTEKDYQDNNSIDKFYEFIESDKTKIKKIITYYNIYTILNKIYLIPDTIIYSNHFFNEELNYTNFKKIKKIIPMTQIPHISFYSETKLKCFFECEFESINSTSIMGFNTNLIDNKYYLNKIKKKNDYINYNNKIFSNNTQNDKNFYIDINIDLNKFKTDFYSVLTKNIEIFKGKSIKEVFYNINLYQYVINNYKPKNITTNNIIEESQKKNIFFKNLINNILFYKNPENILYHNNKYYVVEKVNILTLNEIDEFKNDALNFIKEINEFIKSEIKNTKEDLKEEEEEEKEELPEIFRTNLKKQVKKKREIEKTIIEPNIIKYKRINYFIDIFLKEITDRETSSQDKRATNIKELIVNKVRKKELLDEDPKIILKDYIFITFPSEDYRLKIDEINDRYEIYLDVICYVKNSVDEKISLKKRMTCNFNCYNSANNLDNLFKTLLKQYFDDTTFKKMIKSNKNNYNESSYNTNIKENNSIKEDIKQISDGKKKKKNKKKK